MPYISLFWKSNCCSKIYQIFQHVLKKSQFLRFLVILKTQNLLSNLLPRKFLGKKWIYAHCAFLWEFYSFYKNLINIGFWMTTFSAFPKKSLQSISFELSKGSLERELLCYQKRVRILRLFGRRWKQQSHGSRLPHRGLCESRKPEKKKCKLNLHLEFKIS